MEKHRYSTRNKVEFTVNVGAIYTLTQEMYWAERLGFLLPARRDTWWTLRVGHPIESVADEVLAAIQDYGWPAIQAHPAFSGGGEWDIGGEPIRLSEPFHPDLG